MHLNVNRWLTLSKTTRHVVLLGHGSLLLAHRPVLLRHRGLGEERFQEARTIQSEHVQWGTATWMTNCYVRLPSLKY
jgi:hypothetical protein